MPHPKRVLLIEDHDDSRAMLAMWLRHRGFDVVDYDRCAPAERHLEVGDVDVALLDVRMPDRSGDNFGKELRARYPKMMIVFLTGEEQVERLEIAVPDCFVLRKPFDCSVLMDLLSCVTPAHADAMRNEVNKRAQRGNR